MTSAMSNGSDEPPGPDPVIKTKDPLLEASHAAARDLRRGAREAKRQRQVEELTKPRDPEPEPPRYFQGFAPRAPEFLPACLEDPPTYTWGTYSRNAEIQQDDSFSPYRHLAKYQVGAGSETPNKGRRGRRRAVEPQVGLEIHPLMIELGKRLKHYRRAYSHSPQSLGYAMATRARQHGTSDLRLERAAQNATVLAWERGEHAISWPRLKLFCEALRLPPLTTKALLDLWQAIPRTALPDELYGPFLPGKPLPLILAKLAAVEVNKRQRLEAVEFLAGDLRRLGQMRRSAREESPAV